MIFNSLEFVVFFVVLFALYYFVLNEKTKAQNVLLLIASYAFYAFADWKILPLLIISTAAFYGLAIALDKEKNEKRKKWITTVGVLLGVGTLVYFKYANFFILSFKNLFENIGFHTDLHTLNIVVPVGISFYTFRLLSYLINVNRGGNAVTDAVAFATYVAFFPCILSGPIDRPNTLIPQLQAKRVFNYELATDGLRQILWGLFKKMVIADNCALVVDMVFGNYENQLGSILLLAAAIYTIQLYGDFSGYTDMAIGVAKLLGFRVTKNFNYPFFAQNIADYWRRWHISLTSWLTDYVFMPLNVKWRNLGIYGLIAAIVVNFVVCGLWHGANWTFVVFGFYHGILFIPLILSGKMTKKTKIETYRYGIPKWQTLSEILLTFFLVTLGMIVLKVDNLHAAVGYMRNMFSISLLSPITLGGILGKRLMILEIVIPILLLIEWLNRSEDHGLVKVPKNQVIRWAYYLSVAMIVAMMGGLQQDFVYFQF
jgi:D-alanyl-lipoteichoic acid acyltransferase DltB (MBOAT superfamily)